MTALAPRTAIVESVIDAVLDGQPLKAALKEHAMTPQSFNRLLQGDRAAAAAYARAVEIRADILADEALHIADNENDAAKARNQIGVRQWLASKLHAKRYGDRIDLNVTQTIDIGSTLAEARARLLPGRYLGEVVDSQVVDEQGGNAQRLSDNQSLNPPGNAEPDIFS